MRIVLSAAVALGFAVMCATPAMAQDAGTTSFRGFRLEGNIGGDRFQSEGVNNDKLGYGGTIGFDGVIAKKIVIGPEASYWKANDWNQNCLGVTGGNVCHASFEEVGVGVRAGYLVSPNFLVYGKGGYAMNDQRKLLNNRLGQQVYYNHGVADGYQVGGGVEYTLGQSVAKMPVYVGAQYVYSQYDDHTSRQRLMGSIGIRFR